MQSHFVDLFALAIALISAVLSIFLSANTAWICLGGVLLGLGASIISYIQ